MRQELAGTLATAEAATAQATAATAAAMAASASASASALSAVAAATAAQRLEILASRCYSLWVHAHREAATTQSGHVSHAPYET